MANSPPSPPLPYCVVCVYHEIVCVCSSWPASGIQCVFSKLIQAGDINTDLIQACAQGEVERATVLLEYGADVNSKTWVKNISIVPVTVR